MANIKSLKKILNFLEEQKQAQSPTNISSNLNISFNSVKEVIKTLEQLGHVRIMKSNNTTLIELNEVNQESGIKRKNET